MNKVIDCLMLKTADERTFFTRKTHYPQLVEFARTCQAEISVVKAHDVTVMSLAELARSICDQSSQAETPHYDVVDVVISPSAEQPARNRSRDGGLIAACIQDQFLQRRVVSLATLENQFSHLGVAKPALSRYLARARRRLEDGGYEVIKLRPGRYCLGRRTLNKSREQRPPAAGPRPE